MSAGEEFVRLVAIMRELRQECPWDRSQTHRTLRPYLLEEAYEVLHALDEGSHEALREELGDLMLQIVFHAELAEEAGRFDIEDVLREIGDKLVRRHPHVFGDSEAGTPADVLHRWESIKRNEERKGSALAGIPAELPALVKAVRILSKVRQTGVDPMQGRDAVAEARRWLDCLAEAVEAGDAGRARVAAGMLGLCMADVAVPLRLSPEDALREVLHRLAEAVRAEEARCRAEGRSLADLSEPERAEAGARILAACQEETQ